MMRYESPIIEIVCMEEQDVIRTSGLEEGSDSDHIDGF